MAAKSAPKTPKPDERTGSDERARMRQLFTEPIVDLDVFAEGVTEYRLSDVKGTQHIVEIPNDPPFPVVASLLRANDEWERHQESLASLAGRNSPKDRAAERKLSAHTDRLWFAILKAFSVLLEVRNADAQLTAEALRDDYGAGTMGNWVGTVVMRVQVRRLGPDVERFITDLLSGGDDPKGPEAAPTKTKGSASRSRTRSASSAGTTGGPTTTGDPSAGQSSGGRSTSPGSSHRARTALRAPSTSRSAISRD